jgi:tripartite-type tricarboxylate transporter receptor subunit TctC
MTEFVKLVQANPGKFNYGSGSANSHIAQAMFFSAAKLNLTHVPYRGNGPLLAAALGNEVQINFTGPGSVLPHVRSGKLRLVAVTSIKRFREAPDTPTLDEIGFKGTNFRSWLGMLAPAGTPRPVVMKLNSTINRILTSGPASQILLDRGYDLNPGSPEDFSKFLGSEFNRVSKAIKEFGVTSP